MKRFLHALRGWKYNRAEVLAFVLIFGVAVATADVSIPLRIPVPESTTTGLPGQPCSSTSPGDTTGIAQEGLCESRQALLDSDSGRSADAERHYLKSFSLFDQLGLYYRPAAITILMNIGCFYREINRLADAEQILLKALRMEQDLPPASALRVAMIRSRLGDVYSETPDPEKGRVLLTGALQEFEKETPANKREIAYAYNTLGMIDAHRGAYQTAESGLRKALAASENPPGDTAETAAYQTNLALVLYLERRLGNAEVLLKRAVFMLEQTPGRHQRELATSLTALAAVQSAANEFPAAERASLKVLSLLDELQGDNNTDKVLARINLAGIYLREKKVNEAAKTLPGDVAAEQVYVTDKRVLGDGLRRLAELRGLQKRWDEAAGLYAEAVGMFEAALGASHPGLASVLHEYAEVLKHSGGRQAESKIIEARARSIENALPPV
jgi:tetratricopeptide (TPR) repeat protein